MLKVETGKVNHNKYNVGEILYLLAFMMILIQAVMCDTMFEHTRTMITIYNVMRVTACVLVAVKVLVLERKDKITFYSFLFMLIFIALFLKATGTNRVFVTSFGIYTITFPSYYEPIVTAFLLIGARNVKFENMLKVFIAIVSMITIVAFVASMLGIIENLQYLDSDRGVRNSFGTVYPTCFASHILFIIFSWIWLKRDKWNLVRSIAMLLIGIVIYVLCKALTMLLCIIILFVGMNLWCYREKLKKFSNNIISGIYKFFTIGSAIIASLGMIILSYFYSDSSILAKSPSSLKERFELGQRAFEKYSLKLLGQPIKIEGYAGTTDASWIDEYFVIDCSYQYILFAYGIIFFIIFIAAYTFMGIKYKKEFTMLLIFGAMAIDLAIEIHFVEMLYNPFLLGALAIGGEKMFDKVIKKYTDKRVKINEK